MDFGGIALAGALKSSNILIGQHRFSGVGEISRPRWNHSKTYVFWGVLRALERGSARRPPPGLREQCKSLCHMVPFWSGFWKINGRSIWSYQNKQKW